MFSEGFSFPHPVLGNGSDITGEFNISLDVSRTDDRKILVNNFLTEITNGYMESLINRGDASCFLKIHCSSTFSTWIFNLDSKIEIDENEIANKIEIQALVITKKEILNYYDSSFNPEYEGEIFSLNNNEVIAISGKETIPIEKVDEKLGLGNIFKFFSHDHDKPISFQFMQDKIHIYYPATRSGEHAPKMMFSTFKWTALNIFIIPALADALKFIDEDPENASRYEWYNVIDQLMPSELRSKDFFSNAQLILQTEIPLLLSYTELTKK